MKIWKSHKRKIIWGTLVLLLSIGFYQIYKRLPIINAFAAKNMCSCVFIGDRDQEDVLSKEMQFSLIKYAKVTVNEKDGSVTSSVFGMGTKTAYYNPLKGCTIINESENEDSYTKQSIPNLPKITDKKLELDLDNPNIDYAKVERSIADFLIDSDTEKPFETRTVLVMYKGKIISEKYLDGFDKDSKQLGWSMTKSIFNALIGIAIKEERLQGLEQDHLFSEWKDERKNITLKNILQMSSGLSWTEDYTTISEATVMLYDSDDMVEYASDVPMEAEIGKHWEYSSGSSNLLSGILRNTFDSYQDYYKYPYEKLFAKIGAPSFLIETDAKGSFVASSYAWATVRDWAKFGQLFLENGSCDSEQILPTDWVEFSKTEVKDSKGRYAGHFWLPDLERFPTAPRDMYFAAGFQGQRIFIIPSSDLVIVRFGTSKYEQPSYDKMISGVVEAVN